MMVKQEFKLPFVGLKPGEHHFQYQIKDAFFSSFENSPIRSAEIEIKLKLDKKTAFIVLNFQVDGFVNTICDRCSDNFDLEIMDDYKVYVKFDDELSHSEAAEEDDIVYLKRNETHIELDQFFYEFTLLSLPIKKSCKLNENERPICGKEIFNYFSTEEGAINDAEKPVDPRWEALKKLNN